MYQYREECLKDARSLERRVKVLRKIGLLSGLADAFEEEARKLRAEAETKPPAPKQMMLDMGQQATTIGKRGARS